jgi:hypothetical protein
MLGEIRRSQTITTYGVGSLIAVDNESFIIAGLDTWDMSDTATLWEPRLSRVAGVSEFRLPPAGDPDTTKDGVRAARFPIFYSCPECHELQAFFKFNSPPKKAECGICQIDLVPSRFVIACPHGHLDDFPYWKWVHRSTDFQAGSSGSAGPCGGKLSLRAEGSAASLRGVIVGCSCGVRSVSMEGAFQRKALHDLGIRCTGRRPWLKDAPVEACGEQPRTLQRGSSSAWYPVTHSALSIPPWSDGLHKALAPYWANIKDAPAEEVRVYLRLARFEQRNEPFTIDSAVELVEQQRAAESEPADEATIAGTPRERLYQEEYRTLQEPRPELGGDLQQDFVCEAPVGGASTLREDGIGKVMLVKRLREVRALQSFTRVEEPSAGDESNSPRRAALSLHKVSWLPAIEVSGEGVFVRLDDARLGAWEQHSEVVDRAQLIRANHDALLRARAANSDRPAPKSPASPRYLAVHTLAHILINEWSLNGGYPAASLRERLYVGDGMAGLLIYTATSDSAGSLGGVVAQGEPERLRAALASALARAQWCSNDPLCSESGASGADSLNLSACHACLLLPETSCEVNNTLLDRLALVGSPDGSVPGLFPTQ